MAREQNTVDIVANGGGEGSNVGNTLIYSLPTAPTSSLMCGKICKITIDNGTGVNGRILMMDSILIATVMPAVAPRAFEIGANETVFLNEDDLGELFINAGIVMQASNGATALGYKATTEVEDF